MSATDQRRQAIDFTTVVYRVPTQLIAKAGSGLEPTPASLKGKSVGVLQGSIQETFAKAHWENDGVKVVPYQDQNQVYADLKSGRLDATLVFAPAGQSGFLSKPDGAGFAFVGAPVRDDRILGSGIGYGVRKGNDALKAKLNAAIARVKADGTINKYAKKYLVGILMFRRSEAGGGSRRAAMRPRALRHSCERNGPRTGQRQVCRPIRSHRDRGVRVRRGSNCESDPRVRLLDAPDYSAKPRFPNHG